MTNMASRIGNAYVVNVVEHQSSRGNTSRQVSQDHVENVRKMSFMIIQMGIWLG